MTKRMLESIKIGNVEIKNRIARSATNDHLGNKDGTVSEAQLDMYDELARNNVGMIITGHMCVSERNRADAAQNLICDDKFIEGNVKVSETIHKHGGAVYGQISHSGSKGYLEAVDVNELTLEQIDEIVGQFVSGAKRLEEAGFDGVQVHMAHGYFLSSVLDNTSNLRTDEYGGSDENRMRMPARIIKGIKDTCGENFSVIVKMNTNNAQGGEYARTLINYAKALEELGVDALELSGFGFNSQPRENSEYYLDAALTVKQNVNIPVILVGGIYSGSGIESVLEKGMDMVSMSRPFIAEPDFITKLINGEKDECKCLRCNGCYKVFAKAYKRCVLGGENAQLVKNFGTEA